MHGPTEEVQTPFGVSAFGLNSWPSCNGGFNRTLINANGIDISANENGGLFKNDPTQQVPGKRWTVHECTCVYEASYNLL